MNQYDALKVLGLSGEVTPEQIKVAYKKACSKFHPDRPPAGIPVKKGHVQILIFNTMQAET